MKSYLICPIDTSSGKIQFIRDQIRNLTGTSPNFWNKQASSTYNKEWISNAKFIVIIPPENNFTFKTNSGTIPIEIKRALDSKIPIFFAYKPMTHDTYCFYKTLFNNIRCDDMKGVSGTANALVNFIEENKKSLGPGWLQTTTDIFNSNKRSDVYTVKIEAYLNHQPKNNLILLQLINT